MRQPKIVIVGAGLVGGSAALFSSVAIPSADIVIIDIERVRADAQASVAGMPLELFLTRAGRELWPANRNLVLRSVHEAAKQIKEGQGATH